ncbi:hypothetical protein [Parasitella parasitica]|uniref:Transposase Tc1-like domain-containing protein n=1 Tax=Parasitella parasitica TaxID=35722 RepID=A0A0B7MY91_9FUNG|nr:hypothetical protein [Parasitella parasitica]
MNVLSDKTNTPKRKELAEWQIGGIVNCSRAGVKQSVICKTRGLSPNTVHDVLLRAGKTGDGIPRKRSGGGKALNKRDERALVRQVRAKPLKPMKYHLGAWCEGHTQISIDTFRKYLKNNGFKSYKAAYKPSLSTRHMENRLKWCSGKANWGHDKWKYCLNVRSVATHRKLWCNEMTTVNKASFTCYVVRSDESKFNIVGNDGSARVLRKEGERYDSNHGIKTTKFGSGSLMLWGCFCDILKIAEILKEVILAKQISKNEDFDFLEKPKSYNGSRDPFFIESWIQTLEDFA